MCWVLKANFFHLKKMMELIEKKWFGRNSCHYSDYFSKSAWRPGPCVLVPISHAGGGTQNSRGQQAHLLFIWLCCSHSLLDCDQSFWPHILESLSAPKGNNIVERTLPSSANLVSMKESCQNALAARAFIYLLYPASGDDFGCLVSQWDAIRVTPWLPGFRESLLKSFRLSHLYFRGQGGPLLCTEDICLEELWMM